MPRSSSHSAQAMPPGSGSGIMMTRMLGERSTGNSLAAGHHSPAAARAGLPGGVEPEALAAAAAAALPVTGIMIQFAAESGCPRPGPGLPVGSRPKPGTQNQVASASVLPERLKQ